MPGSAKRRDFPPNLMPLSKAFEDFASPSLRRQARLAMEAVPKLPSQSEIPDDPVGAARALGKMGMNIVEYLGTRSEPRWEMQRKLLQALAAGKFEAWGIQTKPKVKAGPQPIPSHFFSEGKGIAWHSDRVEKFGRRYEGVRVGRPQPAGATQLETPLPAPETTDAHSAANANDRRKPGPKSARDIILQTYEELNSQGRFKTARTLKEIHRILYRTLAKDNATFPHGRGLAYSSFLRHFKNLRIKK